MSRIVALTPVHAAVQVATGVKGALTSVNVPIASQKFNAFVEGIK